MPVKNILSDEVHVGQKGGTTGCGFNTNENPENWIGSSEKITCEKDGCAS